MFGSNPGGQTAVGKIQLLQCLLKYPSIVREIVQYGNSVQNGNSVLITFNGHLKQWSDKRGRRVEEFELKRSSAFLRAGVGWTFTVIITTLAIT